MVAEDFTVDLNKALVFQVGHLGESYQEWVHKPIISKEGPRFFENDVLEIALMVVTGIFIWTLLEYMLHRFLFHIKTKRTNTLHYLLHGCHHKHPQDALRLVFPPAATAILLVPFWNLVKLVSTPSVTPGLVGGGLLGYVMTHYYLHHGQPTSAVPRYLKRYHLNHHFRIQTMGFGITSSFWDRVFGTLPETKSAAKSR